MRRLAIALWLVVCGTPAACRHKESAPSTQAPAPVRVTDTTEGLLFTWVDEKGEFHVEQKATDVPMIGRDAVRVVDPAHEDSTGFVTVVDLRNTSPDGTYPTHTMARADFEELAVERRAKNEGVLKETPEGDSNAVATAPKVIIYGAEWCGACHEAAAYLKRRGITYVEKDIEKDPAAAREMHEKLKRAGMREGSIPVLDVKGRVLVGFSANAVDAALGRPT